MEFGDWVDVEIDEVTSTNAPVALRWIDATSKELPRGAETRWFNGNHYRLVLNYDDSSEVDHFTKNALFDACETGHPLSFALPIDHEFALQNVVTGRLAPLCESEFRKVENSTREEKEKQILKRASELLVVDGELWRTCNEPIYLLKQGVGLVVHVPTESDPSYSPERKFRIDRLDDVIHHFDILDEKWIKNRADVLIPESVCFDDESPALIHAARREVDRHKGSLEKMPTESLLAWARLRDSTGQAEGDPSPTNMDDLVDCLQSIIAATEQHPSYTHDAERALERWSLRPLYAVPDFDDDAKLTP